MVVTIKVIIIHNCSGKNRMSWVIDAPEAALLNACKLCVAGGTGTMTMARDPGGRSRSPVCMEAQRDQRLHPSGSADGNARIGAAAAAAAEGQGSEGRAQRRVCCSCRPVNRFGV